MYIAPSPHKTEPFRLYEKVGGYPITSLYGWRKKPTAGARSFHPGIDVGLPIGTIVFAPGDVHVSVSFHRGFGYRVQFAYGGVWHSLNHMSRSSMMFNGGHYKRGEVIGFTGNSGVSTGPHLHYETTQNGQYVLPSKEVLWFMLDRTAFVATGEPAPEPKPVVEEVEEVVEEILLEGPTVYLEKPNFLYRLFVIVLGEKP